MNFDCTKSKIWQEGKPKFAQINRGKLKFVQITRE